MLATQKGLDADPAALVQLHKTAQGVLRRLAAKGVARAVAAADGARAWERT